MRTELLSCSDAAIARAVELLAAEQPVAFPTETVYGLGARIDRPAAVQRVYGAKGRPADKALIIHVTGVEAARPSGLAVLEGQAKVRDSARVTAWDRAVLSRLTKRARAHFGY